MTLKSFYKNYGRIFPLSVVKMAYAKVQNGEGISTALDEAAKNFAATRSKHVLRYTGYTCISSVIELTVYKLETETYAGLTKMSPYTSGNTRGLSVAKLGENCMCDITAVFWNQPDSILGSYSHRNRYVAVIRLNYGESTLPEATRKKLQNLADTLAKNALAYLPKYLEKNKELQELYQDKCTREVQNLKSNRIEFLESSVLRFVSHVNDKHENASQVRNSGRLILIGDYLKDFGRNSNLKLTIESIDIYGL